MGGSARAPREDKQRDYERQTTSGSAHGFRKHWSRRKSTVHRGYRRTQSTLLSGASALADDVVADDIEIRIANTRRGRQRNTNRSSLGDQVTGTLLKQFFDMVDTFSAGPYRSETQRARTEEVLQRMTRPRPAGRASDGQLRYFTRVVNQLLPRHVNPHLRRRYDLERQREWFAAFLDDAPEWEGRLVRWIADTDRG